MTKISLYEALEQAETVIVTVITNVTAVIFIGHHFVPVPANDDALMVWDHIHNCSELKRVRTEVIANSDSGFRYIYSKE